MKPKYSFFFFFIRNLNILIFLGNVDEPSDIEKSKVRSGHPLKPT